MGCHMDIQVDPCSLQIIIFRFQKIHSGIDRHAFDALESASQTLQGIGEGAELAAQ